ncbi:MAG: hypothetical protein EZS28_048951, partial [Streblomastix strix]
GNNIHIESDNILATGESIKNGNLITVKDLSNPPNIISDLYTSLSYAYDYMGINESIQISNPGTTNLDLHNSLFEQSFTSNVPNPTYIDSINGKDIKFCGLLSTMCKTMKYSININPTPLSGISPSDTNYSIIITSNTYLEDNIQINSLSPFGYQVIIQSDRYSPEAEDDSYTKYSISTSSFSTSLFTITDVGHLSLLGLHFDNLNPSSTNPLISLTTDDNNKIPILIIIDCEFDQDQTPDPIPYVYHSIISINGGQMILTESKINSYYFNEWNFIMVNSDYYSNNNRFNNIEIIQTRFSNMHISGTWYGAAIYAQLYTGNQLLIKDSEFILCKAPNIYGGAAFLNISNDGQASNINDGTLNIEDTTFDRCTCNQPGNGGGI